MKYKKNMLIDDGNYKLIELVTDGVGGEAEVWKAAQVNSAEMIKAIKLRQLVKYENRPLYRELGRKADRETHNWAIICGKSLYILYIYKSFSELILDESGNKYIAHGQICEFSELGNIDTAYKSKALQLYISDESSFLEFLINIIKGIAAGHGEGIIHCDIKPANILLFLDDGNKAVAKISDFGVSSMRHETLQGFTKSYAPPEIEKEQKFSEASDVYSLGLTFFEIIFRTLLKKDNSNYFGTEYNSGEDYSKYIRKAQKSETIVDDFDPHPYFGLFNSMIKKEPSERPSLNEIKRILNKFRRKAAGNGNRYEANLSTNTYIWHPDVHEILRETQYFIFIKGSSPARDIYDIKRDLKNSNIVGYSLHSVTGEWDYVLKVWISSRETYAKLISEIERTATGGYLALKVNDSIFPKHTRPLKIENLDGLVKTIEEITAKEGAFKSIDNEQSKLKSAQLILSNVQPSDSNIQTFILIKVIHADKNLLSYYAEQIKIFLVENNCKSFMIHIVNNAKEDTHSEVNILVTFNVTKFQRARDILMKVYNTLSSFANSTQSFSFSTLFDMSWSDDKCSDDGSLILMIEEIMSHEN